MFLHWLRLVWGWQGEAIFYFHLSLECPHLRGPPGTSVVHFCRLVKAELFRWAFCESPPPVDWWCVLLLLYYACLVFWGVKFCQCCKMLWAVPGKAGYWWLMICFICWQNGNLRTSRDMYHSSSLSDMAITLLCPGPDDVFSSSFQTEEQPPKVLEVSPNALLGAIGEWGYQQLLCCWCQILLLRQPHSVLCNSKIQQLGVAKGPEVPVYFGVLTKYCLNSVFVWPNCGKHVEDAQTAWCFLLSVLLLCWDPQILFILILRMLSLGLFQIFSD